MFKLILLSSFLLISSAYTTKINHINTTRFLSINDGFSSLSIVGSFPSNPSYAYAKYYPNSSACFEDSFILETRAILLNTCFEYKGSSVAFTCGPNGVQQNQFSDLKCKIFIGSGDYFYSNCRYSQTSECGTSNNPYKYMNDKAVIGFFPDNTCDSTDPLYLIGYKTNGCVKINDYASYQMIYPNFTEFVENSNCSGVPSTFIHYPTTCEHSYGAEDPFIAYGSYYKIQMYPTQPITNSESNNQGTLVIELGLGIGLGVGIACLVVLIYIFYFKSSTIIATKSYESTNKAVEMA